MTLSSLSTIWRNWIIVASLRICPLLFPPPLPVFLLLFFYWNNDSSPPLFSGKSVSKYSAIDAVGMIVFIRLIGAFESKLTLPSVNVSVPSFGWFWSSWNFFRFAQATYVDTPQQVEIMTDQVISNKPRFNLFNFFLLHVMIITVTQKIVNLPVFLNTPKSFWILSHLTWMAFIQLHLLKD